MKNATIRQFQIFLAAAKHLSFARAADQMHLTHSAVSVQIKQLEEIAGICLFDRIGKKVFLTEAGKIMFVFAQQFMQTLRDADDSLQALKGLKGGRVVIAATTASEYFAPGLLTEFHKLQTDVRVRLMVANREEVIKSLIANDVDLAVMGSPPDEFDSEWASFAPHPFVMIAAASHPLAGRKGLTLKEIVAETMIVREVGSGTRMSIEDFFREHQIKPRIEMEMGSNEAIKQAVAAGLGISFLSKHTLGLELTTGRLAVLDVVDTPVVFNWFLVRHKSKLMSPALRALWDFILEFGPGYLKRLV
jgi:DNA-binding transcriptional LysR family regulator